MRLDSLIAARRLLKSREAARSAILNGQVFVNGVCINKPSEIVTEQAVIEIRGEMQRYVSRGGYKLEKAIDFFDIDVKGLACLDLGASTGGFTDCLLQHGAALVYAVDVGHGQLDETLNNDSRVISKEGVNARDLINVNFETIPSFATVDLSFISLSLVLPALRQVLPSDGQVVCLVKPQFEAGRGSIGKNGIVRDERVHFTVLENFIKFSHDCGFSVKGITHSPIRGGEGNIEFLSYLAGGSEKIIDIREIVKSAHAGNC